MHFRGLLVGEHAQHELFPCAAQTACTAEAQVYRTGASVVDINVTGNSLGADWDGSAGGANSSALAKGVWSVSWGAWEVLWSCQVTCCCAVTSKE